MIFCWHKGAGVGRLSALNPWGDRDWGNRAVGQDKPRNMIVDDGTLIMKKQGMTAWGRGAVVIHKKIKKWFGNLFDVLGYPNFKKRV